MKSLYVGSGDTTKLLSGKHTKGHLELIQRFVSNERPYHNAKLSPIDALRTGAILEERFALVLDNSYYPQVKEICAEFDALRSSIDFAKIEKGKTVDFIELKTCSFSDFMAFENFRENKHAGIEYIKKKYKNNYNQVQFQLLCSGLNSAKITFLAVYTYDDESNYKRDIKGNEYITFEISRDIEVIEKIKNRASLFQIIKTHLTE